MLLNCTLSGLTFFCLSDLHLDNDRWDLLLPILREVSKRQISAIIILGDVSDGEHTVRFLHLIEEETRRPVYFVLGNHDFYGRYVDARRYELHRLFSEGYLSQRQLPLEISATSSLIGHDGWADGLEGDFFASTVILRDSFEIRDLKGLNREEYFDRINELSDEAVEAILRQLNHARSKAYKKLIIVSHVPAFREVCLWEGNIAHDMWAPHFVSKKLGDLLGDFFSKAPDITGLVLSGHSHHPAQKWIMPNLNSIVLPAACDLLEDDPKRFFDEVDVMM